MYLTKEGLTSQSSQYECNNVCQVKNIINKLTKTNSTTADWKELCYEIKNNKHREDSCTVDTDYTFFDKQGKEHDCIVFIGWDKMWKRFLVWIECDEKIEDFSKKDLREKDF